MSSIEIVKIVLIEDEQPAVEILRSYLQDLEQWDIIGEFDNPIDALSFMNNHHVDVIFLDIQLPRLTGIEFLKTLRNPPVVVITSAYREHAIEAFEFEAFDYLLKPFPLERFLKTVNRINSEFSSRRKNTSELANDGEYIYLNIDRKRTRVRLSDILYIESKKEYIHVITAQGSMRAKQGLAATCDMLPEQFVRIHRSYIVNVGHVSAYSNTVVDISGVELPIGESYHDSVRDALNKIF